MTMGAGPLATAAAQLRVDVYPAGVACDGITVAAGAGAPSLSMSFAEGAPIALDLSPGRHTVVLTAFSDGAATMVIGGACTDADFQPGQAVCLDLTLAPAPDGGNELGPTDLSIDFGMDLSVCQGAACPCTAAPNDSCGLGQFCDVDARCAPGCKDNADCTATPDGGVTDGGASNTPICDTARHSCVQCLAQSDCPLGKLCSASGFCVDGCDPSVGKGCAAGSTCCSKLCVNLQSDISNCGGCGRACGTTGVVTARCSSGLCSSTCVSGAGNCIKPAAPTPDDGCETNIGTNVDNCGACGRPCSATNVSTRQCSAGLCTSSCATGFGNCSTPAAPSADNGCETNTTSDVNHCNGCATSCSAPPNGAPVCAASMCGLGACKTGFYDCDGAAGNGCECGTSCCINPITMAQGCLVTAHTNGIGGNYSDCFPIGKPGDNTTYNQQMALDAANSDTSQTGTVGTGYYCGSSMSHTQDQVCKTAGDGTTGTCTCWTYAGNGAGSGTAGHMYASSGVSGDSGCFCVTTSANPWN